jgi:hypothetical protein
MRRLTLPVALLFSLGVIALAGTILYAMGNPPICTCGYVTFFDASSSSQHLFDVYSFHHVLHGAAFYLLIWLLDRGRLSMPKRLIVAVCLEAGWEIFENTRLIIGRFQTADASQYHGDTIINSVGDMVSMMAGFLITGWLPTWATAILFIAAEVTLYSLTGDSFLLSFLALVLGWRPL